MDPTKILWHRLEPSGILKKGRCTKIDIRITCHNIEDRFEVDSRKTTDLVTYSNDFDFERKFNSFEHGHKFTNWQLGNEMKVRKKMRKKIRK